MAYTGNVQIGGPADTRELPELSITKMAVGWMNNNAYLLTCRPTGERCLIDAAAEPQVLLEQLTGRGLERIVTTHRHRDHWQALAEVLAASGARTAAGRADAEEIPVPTDELLDDGALVPFGRVQLRVITLVGHTPGSIALLYEDPAGRPHLFTGDSLFPGGPGNTEGDPGRFTSLMDDLEAKVFGPLPDETWIYPGHGGDTTLGAERPQLPEWRARGW